ncbi:MAG TPA: response regulator [Anaeromyxobacteraceae bacterium]|nr:response regulator [Anaeromyxobacteraceae bacterium]
MLARKILIVDDNRITRAMLTDIVKSAGFEVAVAESAETAVRVIVTDVPDVAIVDQHLDGIDGSEFVRWLQACPIPNLREVRLIGISGRLESGKDLVDAGACCFVPKPLQQARILEAVHAALDGRCGPAR